MAVFQNDGADRADTPFGRRAVAFGFTLMIELLLLFVLLRLGAPGQAPDKEKDGGTLAISLTPPPLKARADPTKQASDTPDDDAPAAAIPDQEERPKDTPPQQKPEQKAAEKTNARPAPAATAAPLVPLSGKALAGFDLGKIPRGSGTSGTGTGKGPAYGPPGGVPREDQLLNADWLREPTRGELAAYFPAGSKPGWGIIACQTAPRFRVENCQALRDSPGSGIAQALRRAAWQFQVIPPRINGRPAIGAWVRIRFDLTVEKPADAPVPQDD
jgi:hypothetical protein